MNAKSSNQFSEVIDPDELLFQLQDNVKAVEKRVEHKKKVVAELESFEKSIAETRSEFARQKRLFAYLLFERFEVKEQRLIESSIKKLDQLLEPFRPKKDVEDEQEDAKQGVPATEKKEK